MARLPAHPPAKRPSGRPFPPGHKKLGGRKKGTPNRVSAEMRAFLKSVIESPEYQDALRARMIAGRAAHMEQLAAYYTLGKPQEQVQVQTTPSMARLLLMALKPEEKEQGEPSNNLPLSPSA